MRRRSGSEGRKRRMSAGRMRNGLNYPRRIATTGSSRTHSALHSCALRLAPRS